MDVKKYLARGARAVGRAFVKRTTPSLENAFLGVTEGWAMKVAAPALVFGYAAMPWIKGEKFGYYGPQNYSKMEYIGEPPMLAAEGMVNNTLDTKNINQRATNAPTLGATGSLVFGLHQMRKG